MPTGRNIIKNKKLVKRYESEEILKHKISDKRYEIKICDLI